MRGNERGIQTSNDAGKLQTTRDIYVFTSRKKMILSDRENDSAINRPMDLKKRNRWQGMDGSPLRGLQHLLDA